MGNIASTQQNRPGQHTQPALRTETVALRQNASPPEPPQTVAAPVVDTMSEKKARGRATKHQLHATARAALTSGLTDPKAHINLIPGFTLPDKIFSGMGLDRRLGDLADQAAHNQHVAELKLAVEAGVIAAGGWGAVRNGVAFFFQQHLLKGRGAADPVYHAVQAAAATVGVSSFMMTGPMLAKGVFGGAEIKPRSPEEAFPMPDNATKAVRAGICHQREKFKERQEEVIQSISRMLDKHGAACFGLSAAGFTMIANKMPHPVVTATAVSAVGSFLHALGQNLYKTSAQYQGQHLFEAKNDHLPISYRPVEKSDKMSLKVHIFDDILKAAKNQYGVPNDGSDPGATLMQNIVAELGGQLSRHAITFGALGAADYGLAKGAEAMLKQNGAATTQLGLRLGRPSTHVKKLDALISALIISAVLSSTSYFSGGVYMAGRKGALGIANRPPLPPARDFHQNDPVRSSAISGFPAQPNAKRLLIKDNHKPADIGRLPVTHLANTLTNPGVAALEALSDGMNALTRRHRAPQQKSEET